jgi:phage tail sheath protein FI
MAEVLISPGVLARENDSSFVNKRPVTVGAAIIGPTVKGPVEVPTVVTTWNQFQNVFGTTLESGSVNEKKNYTYFTSITAYNYFANGGQSLLVARVVSGSGTSYSPAISSGVFNNITLTTASANADFAYLGNAGTIGSSSFSIQGISFIVTGSTFPANTSTVIYVPSGSNDPNTVTAVVAAFNASASSYSALQFITSSVSASTGIKFDSTTGYLGNSYVFISGSTTVTLSGGTSDVPFALETFSEGIIMNSISTETAGGNLPSGSANNIRWQVINARSASGTFDILVRRGNDGALQPIALETWTNLTLDPNSPNYISRVIGDFREIYDSTNNQIAFSGSFANRSNYLRVSAVNYTTPNFFDNAGIFKPQYTASIPLNISGAFGGAIGDIPGGVNFYNTIGTGNGNTQGLVGSDYANMINLLANTDDYKFNVLFTPGLYSDGPFFGPISNLIQIAQDRGDFIYVIDPVAYGSTISNASSAATARDTSYGAMYWPWLQVVEPSTGEYVWVPASAAIAGVYAYNDSVAEPWFAPAGINRGGLNTVVRAEKKLSQGNRNDLYAAKVNPIATFPGQGIVVYGQKTLQLRASALDRVNVRRLLIALKSYISQIANTLVFEQNSIATRNQFVSQVNPYLTSVQQRQGLYAFKVIMNETNNGPDVIDRNELIGQIYLQPTKTAEFIYLDFNVTPTGATFPA